MKKISWSNPELVSFSGQLSYGICQANGSGANTEAHPESCQGHGFDASGTCSNNGSDPWGQCGNGVGVL